MGSERALLHVEAPSGQAVVVVCGLARHQCAYVTDGLGRGASCSFIDAFEELEQLLPTLTRCDALILSPVDHRGRDALGTVERVVRDWPFTAVVVFCPAKSDPPPSIRLLALAGAHQFVFEGVHPMAATLAQAVDVARRECAAEVVFGQLRGIVPDELHSMAHAVVSRADTLTSVELVSAVLGVHRKTLVNRCDRCGFLQPAESIVWCRLAMVGYMLEHTGATVESIAHALGFASHTALRNLIKRYTGRRATDIRRDGGLSVVLAALGRRLSAWRARELPIP